MADVVVNNDNSNSKELLGQGIRAYVLEDYNSAVSALSKASELLVAEHGDDLHDSLADVYLYYGKALLGLSREETEALGDAVRNKDESDDEEEEACTEAEEGNENEEAEGTKANGTAEVEVDTTTDENNKNEEKVAANGSEKQTNGSAKDEEPSGSGAADSSVDNLNTDEEPTDLQVAWEVLELAKKIFQKRGDDGKKNLAETLVILGEVSLESENFECAINDIKEGLRMQKELFPDDSRTVAETVYKLGIAYSTNTQIDEAVDSFKQSLEFLQRRIQNLEKVKDKEEGVEDEIEEIKGLVPDIEEKIADMKSYKEETLKQMLSAVTAPKTTSSEDAACSSSSEVTSSKPASDISHLVKRKRKLDEILEETEKEAEASPKKAPA